MAFTRAILDTKATLQTSISAQCFPLWVCSVDGFPFVYEGSLAEMEAPRDWHGLTLISSSQRTHWCIDCRADQLETFCLLVFDGAERRCTYETTPRVKGRFHFVVFYFFISGNGLSFILWNATVSLESLDSSSSDDNQWGLCWGCLRLALFVIHLNCWCLKGL